MTTTETLTDQTTGEEAAAKRQKNIGHENFGTSAARQAAALVWAGAEVAAELRENTAAAHGTSGALAAIADALGRQADAAERAAAAAERTANLTQVQAMLAFYGTNERVFPAGVRDQFKAALGIHLASTSEPATAQPLVTPPAVPAPAPTADQSFDEFV